jgi:4-amino-4-deoxy-L-arabinose transferase-like glycosyltransferase
MTNHKSDLRQDAWLATSLFVLTLLSRLPFRSRILYHWDSVNFANGLREFDVLKEHPQPPGYIVYVWFCRLVDLAFRDAQITMVWISIVASALAVVALFYFGSAMWGRRVGLTSALLLASSPLFWFYGEIALPHTLDTLLVILSALCLYKVMQGESRYFLPSVIVLGIAGGVRQQTLVFLAPLALFAMWREGFRRLIVAALLGAIVCLIWFVPLIVSSGGMGVYLAKMASYSARFQQNTSVLMGAGWSGIAYNTRRLAMYTLYGWCAGLVPTVIYFILRLWQRQRLRSWERLSFLALWIAPALGFYTFIHMGQQGLIFVLLPVLLLVSAVGLVQLLDVWAKEHLFVIALAVLVSINAGIFCVAPEYPLGPKRQRLLTRATLVNTDHYYNDRFAAIREYFVPQSTVLLAANWCHVEYYMPEYTTVPSAIVSKWKREGENPSGNPQIETYLMPIELGLRPDSQGHIKIVIFDPELVPLNVTPTLMYSLNLEHGNTIEYLVLKEDQAFGYGARSFGVIEDY